MIALLLLLAQSDPVPQQTKPVVTTIAAVRANPRKFDGQVVRLQGYVNRCIASDCSIQEHPIPSATGPGDSLSIAPDAKFDAVITPLLPTYVEFDARLDAQCLIDVCVGRPPVLTIVSLRGVVSPEPPEIEK